ncbi:MAG: hypothetical protein U0414_40590 [Polyangiaceae bacterium]
MSVIPRNPKTPPATSPNDPRYFEARDLEAELRRTFQVCHECRMCVNYCGSFPELFRRVDRDIESGRAEGAELLDNADFKAIGEECWQCKLCYIKCPYTKDDGATELLDFPRLMAREKAYRAQRDGVTLVDTVLGEPQVVGKFGSGSASGVANLVNANRLVRKVQEKVAGISSEFPLPPMASRTFSSSWMSKREEPRDDHGRGRALRDLLRRVQRAARARGGGEGPRAQRDPGVRMPGEDRVGRDHVLRDAGNLDGGDIAAYTAKVAANVAAALRAGEGGPQDRRPEPHVRVHDEAGEWPEYVPTPEV